MTVNLCSGEVTVRLTCKNYEQALSCHMLEIPRHRNIAQVSPRRIHQIFCSTFYWNLGFHNLAQSVLLPFFIFAISFGVHFIFCHGHKLKSTPRSVGTRYSRVLNQSRLSDGSELNALYGPPSNLKGGHTRIPVPERDVARGRAIMAYPERDSGC